MDINRELKLTAMQKTFRLKDRERPLNYFG